MHGMFGQADLSFRSPQGAQRALFLDRDGVINVDRGYVHRANDFEFIEGIFDVARAASASGFKVVVITNQAGIGRGFYSEDEFHKLTGWMCKQFEKEGAPIAKVYFSPFHPTHGLGKYRKDDITRKPRPGMILQAQQQLRLDLGASVLIGDRITDIQAGVAAGVGLNMLFATGHQAAGHANKLYRTIATLAEAVPFLAPRVRQEQVR